MKYLILYFFSSFFYFSVSAAAPDIECGGLPGCEWAVDWVTSVIGNVIAEGIKYVAVIAVLAVMYGGIMYLLSSGDEEKTWKAKNVILWSLVGVILSVAAWSLINILNNFRI